MATANPVTIEASFEQNSVPDPNTLGIDFTANSTPHPSANFVYFSGLFGTQKFGVSTNDKVKNWTAGIDEFNYNGIPKTTRVLVSGVWTVVPVWLTFRLYTENGVHKCDYKATRDTASGALIDEGTGIQLDGPEWNP